VVGVGVNVKVGVGVGVGQTPPKFSFKHSVQSPYTITVLEILCEAEVRAKIV